MAQNKPLYIYKTIQELRLIAENCDPALSKYVNFFAVIKAELYFNLERGFRTYEITDDTNSFAILSLKIGPKPYPELKVGNVIRVHCCKVHIYTGKLECNLSAPQRIVVYSKTDNDDINRVTVAENPSFQPTDNDRVRALFEVDLFPEEPGEEFTLSQVFQNGVESDVLAQLIGYHVLNDGTTNNAKRAFAFFWDGTKCTVCNLKKHKPFKFDNPNNPKSTDDQLAFRAKGYAHDFFIFDNMAVNIVNFKPGDIVFLEGVVIKYGKENSYLTVKGNIRKVQETDRNAKRLLERLAKVPLPRESIDSMEEEEIMRTLQEPDAPKEGNGNRVVEKPVSSTSAHQEERNDTRVVKIPVSSTSAHQEERNDSGRVEKNSDSSTSAHQESIRFPQTSDDSSIPQAEPTSKDQRVAVANFNGRNSQTVNKHLSEARKDNAIQKEQSNSEQNGNQPSSLTLPQRGTEDNGDISKQTVPKTSKRLCQVDDEGWMHCRIRNSPQLSATSANNNERTTPVTQILRPEQPVSVNASEQPVSVNASEQPVSVNSSEQPLSVNSSEQPESANASEQRQEPNLETTIVPVNLIAFTDPYEHLAKPSTSTGYVDPQQEMTSQTEPIAESSQLNHNPEERNDLRHRDSSRLKRSKKSKNIQPLVPSVPLQSDKVVPLTVHLKKRAKVKEIEVVDLTKDEEDRPKNGGGAIKIQGKTRVFKYLPQRKLKTIELYLAKLEKPNGESGSSYHTAQSSIESEMDLDSQLSIRAERGSQPSLPETQESQSQSQSMIANVSRSYANYNIRN